jgi:hypothetical protein
LISYAVDEYELLDRGKRTEMQRRGDMRTLNMPWLIVGIVGLVGIGSLSLPWVQIGTLRIDLRKEVIEYAVTKDENLFRDITRLLSSNDPTASIAQGRFVSAVADLPAESAVSKQLKQLQENGKGPWNVPSYKVRVRSVQANELKDDQVAVCMGSRLYLQHLIISGPDKMHIIKVVASEHFPCWDFDAKKGSDVIRVNPSTMRKLLDGAVRSEDVDCDAQTFIREPLTMVPQNT